jgi:5'-3' exonuclease
VDNIPGVRGVGKKTAVTLLKKYDCIDGIYENVDDVGKDRGLDSCMRICYSSSRFCGDT